MAFYCFSKILKLLLNMLRKIISYTKWWEVEIIYIVILMDKKTN